MTLTYKQIWEQKSYIRWFRKLSVKRLKDDGSYEAGFTDISHLKTPEGSVNSFSQILPNSSYQFGKVQVPNASMTLLSPHQEFANENEPRSIFKGFIRHRSIIRIQEGIIDDITDPDNPEQVLVTLFQGLINADTAVTQNGEETFSALDFIKVLDEVNVKTLELNETTLNDLVYELVNRTEFTNLFNVSNSTTYIDAGYNATNIDTSVYDGSVLEMLQDLAKGHSIFYIDPDDNYFYFKEVTPTSSVQHEFHELNNRKISIENYREGRDRLVTRWFWQDTALDAATFPVPTVEKTGIFQIDGITNTTQRQNLLNFVLTKTNRIKPYFDLKVPYLPVVKLLDRVTVQEFGYAPPDAARFNQSKFDEARFVKPSGIRINKETNWMVRGIRHSRSLDTTLELEQITP